MCILEKLQYFIKCLQEKPHQICMCAFLVPRCSTEHKSKGNTETQALNVNDLWVKKKTTPCKDLWWSCLISYLLWVSVRAREEKGKWNFKDCFKVENNFSLLLCCL